MPTGTGKSTVGLLYLLSHMHEAGRPVVYLCPTVQLVDQVLSEASKIGIEAYRYPKGEPHPHPRCTAAEAIIVCTYDKLFNALTTFNRSDVGLIPAAIVLDDAHSGVEEVRDRFTLRLTEGKAYDDVMAVLDGAGRAYWLTQWEEIRARRPAAEVELPYWSWRTVVNDVRRALAPHADADVGLKFTWPYLRDSLRWCRCVVSGDGIEIVPIVPLVEGVRPYASAGHRLFMSATLADDAVLVRELGCDVAAATNPVMPKSEGGLGERMVLAPSLLEKTLDRNWVMKWAAEVSKKHNVVVLCSSEKQTVDWAIAGARAALGDKVAPAVEELKAGTLKFAAFAQRYDGIDLPDDACRVLVLDGVPFGSGIVDRYDSANPALAGGVRNRTLNRIEQGMGRAVRSNADYAVCVLAGPELANFTTRRDVQERMSPDIRIQLRLAKELAELAQTEASSAADAFEDLVRKCLSRDGGWKAFYGEKVRKEVAAMAGAPVDPQQVTIADAERQAVVTAVAGDPAGGYAALNAAIANAKISEVERAAYLQLLANLITESDPGQAVTLQKAAFAKTKVMFRPPPGADMRPTDPGRFDVAANVIKEYEDFANGNGLIALFQTLKPSLAMGVPAHRFEGELKRMFALIGVQSSRPEQEWGAGPDNLALWPELSLVIEAKNEAKYDKIPKKDAEQLLHSMQWFKDQYAARTGTPVFVGPTDTAGANIYPPPGTRVITPKLLDALGACRSKEAFRRDRVGRSPGAFRRASGPMAPHGLHRIGVIFCRRDEDLPALLAAPELSVSAVTAGLAAGRTPRLLHPRRGHAARPVGDPCAV